MSFSLYRVFWTGLLIFTVFPVYFGDDSIVYIFHVDIMKCICILDEASKNIVFIHDYMYICALHY